MTDRSLDLLIDEVALGLADDADVARLGRMAQADPAIAARLDQARQRLLALDDTADALPLPEGFWTRLEARLDAEEATTPPAAPQPAQQNVVELSSIRNAMHRWRATAVAGMAAALMLGVMLAWVALSRPEHAVIAVLLNDAGEAIALVEGLPDNTTRITLLERQNVAADQVMQVWTKPEEDGPPVSLGLLSTGRSSTLTIDGLPTPRPQQLYEITFEPAGGSPTQLPTGPILGKGLAKEPVT